MSFFTKLPRERYAKDAFDGFRPTSEFVLGTGKAMAWMSQLAYETDDEDKIKSILGDWGLRLVSLLLAEVETVLPIAITHGLVAERDDAAVVAFAGTDPFVLANWLTDFDARLSTTHASDGFQTAVNSIMPAVRTALAQPAVAGKKLFLTGHSLGGALSHLTAKTFAEAGAPGVEAVYTIGCPRVGDAEFAAAYDRRLGARTFRLVHGEDIVPSVPPENFGLGFRHVGRYLHCARQGRFSAAELAPVGASNDPGFTKGISQELIAELHHPLNAMGSALSRLALPIRVLAGQAPPGMRTDLGGVTIELLPLRARDHMPDRYIAALS
jgi:triacylglycerol lipase